MPMRDNVRGLVVPDDAASARIKARVAAFMKRSGAGVALSERLERMMLDCYADGFSDAIVCACATDDLEIAETQRPEGNDGISGRLTHDGKGAEKLTDGPWRCQECWMILSYADPTEELHKHVCPKTNVVSLRGRVGR